MALVDVDLFRRAVENLVTNSINAINDSGARGTVRIEATRVAVEPDRASEVATGADPAAVISLTVSDDGPGFEGVDQARLFEPFYSSRRSQGGWGLGLSMVHAFADRCGGSVEVVPVATGASLKLLMPAASPSPVPSGHLGADPDATPDERGLVGVTVLVIDDDSHVVDMLHDVLEARGANVVIARTVAESIAAHAARPETIDVVLCDILLGAEMGPDAIRVIRRSDPTIPVVYISGYSPTRVEDFSDEVAGGWLPKPFETRALIDALTIALAARA